VKLKTKAVRTWKFIAGKPRLVFR